MSFKFSIEPGQTITFPTRGKYCPDDIEVTAVVAGIPSEIIISVTDNILYIENYDLFPEGTLFKVTLMQYDQYRMTDDKFVTVATFNLTEKTHDLSSYWQSWYQEPYKASVYTTIEGATINSNVLEWYGPPKVSFMGPPNILYYNIENPGQGETAYKFYLYTVDGDSLTELGSTTVTSTSSEIAPVADAISASAKGYNGTLAIRVSFVFAGGIEGGLGNTLYFTYGSDGSTNEVV